MCYSSGASISACVEAEGRKESQAMSLRRNHTLEACATSAFHPWLVKNHRITDQGMAVTPARRCINHQKPSAHSAPLREKKIPLLLRLLHCGVYPAPDAGLLARTVLAQNRLHELSSLHSPKEKRIELYEPYGFINPPAHTIRAAVLSFSTAPPGFWLLAQAKNESRWKTDANCRSDSSDTRNPLKDGRIPRAVSAAPSPENNRADFPQRASVPCRRAEPAI